MTDEWTPADSPGESGKDVRRMAHEVLDAAPANLLATIRPYYSEMLALLERAVAAGAERRITHALHHDHITLEYSEDSTPDSWWINLQLLYPDAPGSPVVEHLAEVGMTDVEVMDLVHDLVAMVIGGRVKFNVEAAVQERYEEEIEAARHDMPADLFNELAEFLLRHPGGNNGGLFLLERLRSRYGASTRRNFGLDQVTPPAPEPTHVRDVKEYRAPGFWETEHSENL
jgi:hypothetical protein